MAFCSWEKDPFKACGSKLLLCRGDSDPEKAGDMSKMSTKGCHLPGPNPLSSTLSGVDLIILSQADGGCYGYQRTDRWQMENPHP